MKITINGGDLFPTYYSVQIQLVFADEDFGIGRNRNLFNEGIKMAKKQIVKKSKFKFLDVYEETRGIVKGEQQIYVRFSYRGYDFTRLIDVSDDTIKSLNKEIREDGMTKLDTARVRKAYQLPRYEEQ